MLVGLWVGASWLLPERPDEVRARAGKTASSDAGPASHDGAWREAPQQVNAPVTASAWASPEVHADLAGSPRVGETAPVLVSRTPAPHAPHAPPHLADTPLLS